MNILYEQFPEEVKVNGEYYPIVTDFREWIRFTELVEDDSVPWRIKCGLLLQWYLNQVPEDIEAAIYALGDFLMCKRMYQDELEDEEEEQQKKVKMAKDASFEERFLVTGLLLDGLNGSFLTYEKMDGETGAVYQELLHLKAFLQDKKDMTALDEFTDMKKKSLAVRLEAELLTADQQTTEELVIRILEEFSLTIRKEHITETEAGFERIRQLFTEMAEKRKACAKKITGELEQAFAFMKECFGDGQETVLFVTGLTRNTHAAAFIREYGCDPYFACSEKLLYRKQERKLQEECASLLEI